MSTPSILDLLNIGRPPETADAIFVFAGREERKRFGLELFQAGYAPRLVLSVARFEWRRFAQLGLAEDGGLVDMTSTIEPPRRHFFVEIDADQTTCEKIPKGRLGTMSEARALARWVERHAIRRLLLVSSWEHLPRCLFSVRRFVGSSCRIVPVASPASGGSLWSELFKLTGYSAVMACRSISNPRNR